MLWVPAYKGFQASHCCGEIPPYLEIEQSWQATGLTASNAPAYQKHYEEFLFQNSDKFGTYKVFEATKSLKTQTGFGFMKTWRPWCNAHLDFIVATCHATVNTVMSQQQAFLRQTECGRDLLSKSFHLGGGFKYFLFLPLLGEMIQFDNFSKWLKPPTSHTMKPYFRMGGGPTIGKSLELSLTYPLEV